MSSSRKAAEEISFRTVQHGSELYQGKYGTIKKCLSAYGKPMIYEKIPSTSSKEIEKQCNCTIDFSHSICCDRISVSDPTMPPSLYTVNWLEVGR